MPVVAISIGTGMFLVLTFYGYQFFRYQRDMVSGETLTHITAMCEDISDQDARFTEVRLAELRAKADIAMVYPKLEQGVSLTAGIAGQMQIPAEGIQPGDPRLDAEKLEWCTTEPIAGSAWVVISRQVFEKLGGSVRNGEPHPSTLTLRVARKKDGREEQLEVPVTLSGILKRQKTDRAYIPQGLARRLDKYASHRIDTLDEKHSPSKRAEYDCAYAYVRAGSKSRLAADAEYLNIEMSPTGQVEVLVADNLPIWGLVSGSGEYKVRRSDLDALASSVPGTESYPEFTATLQTPFGKATVAALLDDDPRWSSVSGGMPAKGILIAKDERHRGRAVGTSPAEAVVGSVCEALPVESDFICSREALAWLQFRPTESRDVDRDTLLVTESPTAARAMADAGLEVRCESSMAWRIYMLASHPPATPSQTNAAPLTGSVEAAPMAINQRLADVASASGATGSEASGLAAILNAAKPAQSGFVDDGILSVEYGLWGKGKAVLQGRAVPDGLFEILAMKDHIRYAPDESVPCILVGQLPEDIRGRQLSADGRRLRVCSTSSHLAEKPLRTMFWLPKSASNVLSAPRSSRLLAVWGRWDQVMDAERQLEQRGLLDRLLASDGPASFWSYARESENQAAAELSATGGTVGYAKLWVSSTTSGRIATVVEQRGLRASRVQELLRAHRRMTLMDKVAFCDAVFEANETRYIDGACRELRYSISTPSPLGYKVLSEAVLDMGQRLHALVPMRKESWDRYSIADKSTDDGRVADSLIRVIAMTKPTFAAAEPFVRVDGTVGKTAVPLIGTTTGDPLQFAAKVCRGGWVPDGSAPAIVLPSGVAPIGSEGENPIGQFVQVKFQREDPVTDRAESLAMALQVVGLTETESAYIPVGLARDLYRWGRNECLFNATKGTFETPMEMYERRGFIRANVVAASADAVEPLVRWLESEGYRTESSLGNIAGLKQLGKSLAIIVLIFSIGTLMTAAITVLVTALMNVNSKSWEIGLLKALGVGDREILSIFLIQALLISVAGFLGAGFIAGFIEPLLFRGWLAAVFGNGISDVIRGSIAGPENWFLGGIAFAVAIGFSLIGMAFPAAKACRVIPVEALNNRE